MDSLTTLPTLTGCETTRIAGLDLLGPAIHTPYHLPLHRWTWLLQSPTTMYWRFNDMFDMSKHQLLVLADNAGYPTYALTKIELQKLAHRLQRSLVCYNRCSNDELLKFMQDRGIAAPFPTFRRTQSSEASSEQITKPPSAASWILFQS
ncbi:hypothetical protein LTS10_007854 [Elasticomyces elasticus]|nr:hypothetical protein LTS10_007854 [Elasticomyces elasticus]